MAHNGVLFMDEFPEFPRHVLETLRQPIETGEVMVARANTHVKYPSRFMLIAAAKPCRCGYLSDPARACARAPDCGADYLGRIPGLLLNRFDLRVDVTPVAYSDLKLPCDSAPSAEVPKCRCASPRLVHGNPSDMPKFRAVWSMQMRREPCCRHLQHPTQMAKRF